MTLVNFKQVVDYKQVIIKQVILTSTLQFLWFSWRGDLTLLTV